MPKMMESIQIAKSQERRRTRHSRTEASLPNAGLKLDDFKIAVFGLAQIGEKRVWTKNAYKRVTGDTTSSVAIEVSF